MIRFQADILHVNCNFIINSDKIFKHIETTYCTRALVPSEELGVTLSSKKLRKHHSGTSLTSNNVSKDMDQAYQNKEISNTIEKTRKFHSRL